jgi:hypothetical protein
VVVILTLDDGDGDVRLVIKDVISALLFPALMDFPPNVNPPVREADILANLSVNVPTRRHECGRDELGADVAFAQLLFAGSAMLWCKS